MFECLETSSLIMERYETEGNLMVNHNEGSIGDRSDLPYKQKMELLDKQRMGKLQKDWWVKIGVAAGLAFTALLAILGIFPQVDAYVVGAFILTGGAFIAQRLYACVGVINSRMEVLATEETWRRDSTQSPPCEQREKATWRTRRR